MRSQGYSTKRWIRIVAAILLACLGAELVGTLTPIGIGLVCAGLGAAVLQGFHLWRERRDPYDLSLLWEDARRDEPDEAEERKERELTYCHRCGASMPQAYKICPGCGAPLGR